MNLDLDEWLEELDEIDIEEWDLDDWDDTDPPYDVLVGEDYEE